MSRTFKTDPAWVKAQKFKTQAEQHHSYRCEQLNEPCDIESRNGRCQWWLPAHAAKEPWHRRGTKFTEKRSQVKQVLGCAAITANSGGDLEGLLMPDPTYDCLCYLCS